MIANNESIHSHLLRIVVACILFTFIGVIFLGFYLRLEEKKYQNYIYPNVYINNIPFGKKTKSDIKKIFETKSKQLDPINIQVFYENEKIATYSARQLKIRYDGAGIADRAYLIGRSSNLPSRIYQQIVTLFGISRFDFIAHLEYDREVLKEFINDAKDKYEKPAQNALFRFENSKVVSFRQEESGLALLTPVFFTSVDQVIFELEKKPANKNIVLKNKIISPDITLSEANNFGITELIAVGKSDYTHSIPERVHNVLLAASKFNGILIPKGKVFSFDETIGDISSLTGYQPAYIIKNGKTILGDGGGVCQVSTTFFRAALNAGLPIVERNAHAYRVGYYENDSKPGFDATIFSPTVDLKIKNDTPASILVETEVDKQNNLLFFKLYGKKDGRRVEITNVALYDFQPAPPTVYQDDPILKKGIVKQVDFSAPGAKAKFDYKVVRGNDVVFQNTFYSAYRPWAAVYLVGQAD